MILDKFCFDKVSFVNASCATSLNLGRHCIVPSKAVDSAKLVSELIIKASRLDLTLANVTAYAFQLMRQQVNFAVFHLIDSQQYFDKSAAKNSIIATIGCWLH